MTPDDIAQLQRLTGEWKLNGKRATEIIGKQIGLQLELHTITNRQRDIEGEAKALVFPSVLDGAKEPL